MPESQVRPDQAQRDRIVQDLNSTLFVEAGAGSGKTTELVNRVIALVTSGTAELQSIAAITFTEKAGAELRDRIRRALEEMAAQEADADIRAYCRTALDQLDGAALGTLHSFALRLLSEFPIEAGLPPRVEVLDEVTSGLEFDRRWTAFRDQLLADPELERTILLLLATGVRHEALRALAVAFDQNWDLVEERVLSQQPEPPAVQRLLERALEALDGVCAERGQCRDPGDRLYQRLYDIAEYCTYLRTIDDEVALLEAITEDAFPKPPSFAAGGAGQKGNWSLDLAALRNRVKEAGTGLAEVRQQVAQACAFKIGAAVRRFTLAAADERRVAGHLEFHDLLVLCRSLLRNPTYGAAVRSLLHQRYQRLLLDEFQDTDPIQIELAMRIASGDPRSPRAGEAPWTEVSVEPGHLFIVGDPKQSIYRFRRADISTFLRARDVLGSDGVGLVNLTANFRTGKPVIDWVNHTFDALMSEDPDTEVPVPSQPKYVALQAMRLAPEVGPPVSVMGRFTHPKATPADDLRAAEAGEVVRAVTRAVTERWMVGDGYGGWRQASLGDITILVPARTSLPFLENALEGAGIPYRAESSSLIYATRAVRDLLMVLRAIDDPTNHLNIVTALRTPLLGCGDDDLFRFKVERKGRWNYLADQPPTVPKDDPVLRAIEFLRSLHQDRRWLSPAELLDRIARDRRAFELGFAEGRPRDVWRRLRFVIDQARGWSDATGGSLREYLQWVERQSGDAARVAEAVLPETDDDAVRIMTIHAAKGLEFPITIVSGMSTVPSSRRAPAEVVFPPTGGVGYRFGRHVTTEEFEAWKPIDEQMGFHERIRLLYVASTRARDHLVLSLHRKERAVPPKTASARTNAELLLDGMGGLIDTVPDAGGAGDGEFRAVALQLPNPPQPFDQWVNELHASLARAGRPTTVAATALRSEVSVELGEDDFIEDQNAGLQKRPRDLELPPWLKGRYGTAVGRAVHGVLQTIDLSTGEGRDNAIAAQCQAEAVTTRAGDVRRLVDQALASPSVREAAVRPHWREVYTCTLVNGRLLEGYVDLLYRGPDGLVILDYKTAATGDAQQLDRRVTGYRLQGASYAVAIAAAAAEPVSRVTFVFLTPDGANERELPDLDSAVAEVRSVVSVGNESLFG